jgi:hypothetical protein
MPWKFAVVNFLPKAKKPVQSSPEKSVRHFGKAVVRCNPLEVDRGHVTLPISGSG